MIHVLGALLVPVSFAHAAVDTSLVVVWDHQGSSFIVTLDAATGKELWAIGAPGDRQLGHAARRRRHAIRIADAKGDITGTPAIA